MSEALEDFLPSFSPPILFPLPIDELISVAPASSLLVDNWYAKQLVRNNLIALKNKIYGASDDEYTYQKMIEMMVERLENANKTSCILNCKRLNKNNLEVNQNEREKLLHYIVLNTNVPPVIQNGPSCGLAALSMALHMLFRNNKNDVLEVDEILETAKLLGFTKQGEMFSSENLLNLSFKINNKITGRIIDNSITMNEKKKLVLEAIFAQHPILVPYDKDFNNEPCLKDGTKAHWALITGLLIAKTEYDDNFMQMFKHPSENSHIFYLTKETNQFKEDLFIKLKNVIINEDDESSEIFIFAMQGKSLKPHLWNIDKLLESNNQLNALDPTLLKSPDDYHLPINGIQTELSGKIIILCNKLLNHNLG